MKREVNPDFFKLYIERALGIYGSYKAVADVAKIHPTTLRKWHEGKQQPRAGRWATFKRLVDFDMKRKLRPRKPVIPTFSQ